MSLYLVRHARPIIDPERPPEQWRLDPAYLGDIEAIRPRLPRKALWACSPEPKAVDTALLLGAKRPRQLEELREVERTWIDPADFEDAVRRSLADPDVAPVEGWETGRECQTRITQATRDLLDEAGRGHVVLVGHGTAFTLLVAALTQTPPDIRRWRSLVMPDLIRVDWRQIVRPSE
ncbi:MAG: histidine phosphatase family protein [Nocardioides sp.]|jgi:broad specificity phosphatase PhoE